MAPGAAWRRRNETASPGAQPSRLRPPPRGSGGGRHRRSRGGALGRRGGGAEDRRGPAALGLPRLIGQACQRGCDVAAQVLNGMGYAVELMNADSESSPDVARTQAEKLIREGAHILLGAFESGATAAVAQVAEQKGVPLVIHIGS